MMIVVVLFEYIWSFKTKKLFLSYLDNFNLSFIRNIVDPINIWRRKRILGLLDNLVNSFILFIVNLCFSFYNHV